MNELQRVFSRLRVKNQYHYYPTVFILHANFRNTLYSHWYLRGKNRKVENCTWVKYVLKIDKVKESLSFIFMFVLRTTTLIGQYVHVSRNSYKILLHTFLVTFKLSKWAQNRAGRICLSLKMHFERFVSPRYRERCYG